MKVTIDKSKIGFLFISLLILTYPINYDLGSSLRLADIGFIIFFIWSVFNQKLKISNLSWIIITFFTLYVFSTIYGTFFIGILNPLGFFFIYKYTLPFLLFWIIFNLKLKEKKIIFLFNSYFFVFFILSLYVYIHIYLVINGVLLTSLRPSFPFTFREDASDAHLYSSYISYNLTALISFVNYKIISLNRLLFYFILCLSLVALILTGSRNGLAALVVSMTLIGGQKILQLLSINKIKIKPQYIIGALLCILILFLAGNYFDIKILPELSSLSLRTINFFNLAEDKSTNIRIINFNEVIKNVVTEGPILIGIGFQSYHIVWLDTSIGSLLIASGIVGLCVFIAIILIFLLKNYYVAIKNSRKKEFYSLALVTFNYILTNIATEFFLVTRSIVPFIIFIALSTQLIYIKKNKFPIKNNTCF
ncbi:O-antigen polymerase [Laspinema olomoucense]|uniref:O-antigen polymerase n=1 Tax=Laspinema olomoucense TaxID=3231600 RepID=UPI0021BBA751|nr:O-antigen polymerase [Laspinema sp. D3c]MCT7995241.1 oligosaccharide repeat unit polymerase [Laspinema sp. D3c]